jgi:hypothetical protein
MDQQSIINRARSVIKKISRSKYTTHTGCSLAAVGPDHWCWYVKDSLTLKMRSVCYRGLILPDDIRHMTETAESLVGTTINEDLQAYRSRGIDERTWNTENAPLFQQGYPKLTDIRGKLIAGLQGWQGPRGPSGQEGKVLGDLVEVHPGSELVSNVIITNGPY